MGKIKSISSIIVMLLLVITLMVPSSKVDAMVDETNANEKVDASRLEEGIDESNVDEKVDKIPVSEGLDTFEVDDNVDEYINPEARIPHYCTATGSTIGHYAATDNTFMIRACRHNSMYVVNIYAKHNYVGYNHEKYGNSVKVLQISLNAFGYGLQTDGRFGANTHSALVDFQRKCGLSVDGTAGPATWKALNSRLPNY